MDYQMHSRLPGMRVVNISLFHGEYKLCIEIGLARYVIIRKTYPQGSVYDGIEKGERLHPYYTESDEEKTETKTEAKRYCNLCRYNHY